MHKLLIKLEALVLNKSTKMSAKSWHKLLDESIRPYLAGREISYESIFVENDPKECSIGGYSRVRQVMFTNTKVKPTDKWLLSLKGEAVASGKVKMQFLYWRAADAVRLKKLFLVKDKNLFPFKIEIDETGDVFLKSTKVVPIFIKFCMFVIYYNLKK